jgi:hypothetical protein
VVGIRSGFDIFLAVNIGFGQITYVQSEDRSMSKGEASCGKLVKSFGNKDPDNAGAASLEIVSVKSEGGCEGITIRITNARGTLAPGSEFTTEIPLGPDRYAVPAGGKLELWCGNHLTNKEAEKGGKCTIEWNFKWVS